MSSDTFTFELAIFVQFQNSLYLSAIYKLAWYKKKCNYRENRWWPATTTESRAQMEGGGQKKVCAPARTNDVTRKVGEKSPNSEAQLRETPASWIKNVSPLKDQEFPCVSRRLSFFIHRPACLIRLYPLSTLRLPTHSALSLRGLLRASAKRHHLPAAEGWEETGTEKRVHEAGMRVHYQDGRWGGGES